MVSLDEIVSLAKRRGFVFPSSEIYGGFSAVYDLGPYGTELANNIKNHWWKAMVYENQNIVGLDSAIFMSPKIWEASGHVGGFSDPLVEHKSTHQRYRVDMLLTEIGIDCDEKSELNKIQELFNNNFERLNLPTKTRSEYTEVKNFNLLVKSNLGNVTENMSIDPVYLRGETCQGIYVNVKNVMDSTRVKIPFGIAQIGKAFRNEITPKQWIFRTREFEQMEMQYLVRPEHELEQFDHWLQIRLDYYTKLGIDPSHLRKKEHENLAFYAKKAVDIKYEFPMGFLEIEGIHARGDYDLNTHQKSSGLDLSVTDPETNDKYLPHIVETSTGVGRNLLMHLTEAYATEGTPEGTRTVLKLPKELAPIKVAVFPLLKNKPELVEKAKNIFDSLKGQFYCEFDDNGNIGKRYRRQDEIGTPYCITVDFESLEKGDVTLRDRDSMQQERVSISQLGEHLGNNLNSI